LEGSVNRTLAVHLVVLEKRQRDLAKATIRLANLRLTLANNRLAAYLGWDVPVESMPVTWGSR
jgi:hypothetical protein